jgi:hypothetical protein
MLKIKIGSTWIDARDLDIPVTLRSPLFLQNGRIPGSYVFNFQVPLTQALKAEIGYRNRPASGAGKLLNKTFYLELGPLKYSGDCSVKATGETTAEISAPINTGSLAALLKSTKLTEIDLGGLRESESTERLVLANTTEDIVVDEVVLTYDGVLTFPIEFNDISVNPYGILNVDGDTLQILETGKIILIFKIDHLWTQGITEMRIYKSDTPVFIRELKQGMNFVPAELDVIDNDILELKVSGRRVEGGLGYTKTIFTIYAGAELSVYKQGEFSLDKGTDLYPGDDYAVFPLENQKMLDNLDDDIYQIDHLSIKEVYSKFFPVLNHYRDNKFPLVLYGESEGEGFAAFNMFNPFPYLAYVIKQVAKHFNITISNNVFEDNDLKQLVIFNLFAENSFITSELIQPRPGFDLKDHVPDEKISDFLNEISKLLGIALDYNSYTRTLRFKNLVDVISDRTYQLFPGLVDTKPELTFQPKKGYRLTQRTEADDYVKYNFRPLADVNLLGSVATYNDLPETGNQVNDCYYVTFTRVYMYWTYDEDEGNLKWMLYSYDFQHVMEEVAEDEDGEVIELESAWSAVMDSLAPDNNINAPKFRSWRIPRIDQPGNFEGTPANFFSKFSKCLLFYRGMHPDSLGQNYPLGTNSVYRFPWVKISEADLELRWDGPYGLWEKRHKDWTEWLAASPGYWTIKAYLTPLQLAQLDFFKWYRILNHDFLIREVKFTISITGVSVSEIDLMKR